MTAKLSTRLFPRGIRAQLFFLFASLLAVFIVLLGTILVVTGQTAMRRTVMQGHRLLAERTAGEIELILDRPLESVRMVASMLGVLGNSWDEETVLVQLSLDMPVFEEAVLVGRSGRKRAGSNPGAREERWWDDAMLAQSLERKGFNSGFKVSSSGKPYMIVGVPVSRQGKTAGALIARLDLRSIWRLVDRISIGRSGHAYITMESGDLIAHRDKKLVLREKVLAEHAVVKAARGAGNGNVEWRSEDGRGWLSSFALISGYGWWVVVEQESREAYSFRRVMIGHSFLVLFLGLVISLFISYAVARRWLGPVDYLVRRTRALATGYFGRIEHEPWRGEFGELVRSFEEMAVKLERAREQEKLSVVGEVATELTHELRGPMSVITNYMQVYSARKGDKGYLRRFERTVPREARRLLDLLDRMSDFSRREEFSLERLDVRVPLLEVLDFFREEMKRGRVRLRRGVGSKLMVMGDADALKGVFVNLIKNALQAMPQGGELRVSARRGGRGPEPVASNASARGRIVIAFQDNGPGLKREERSKLFKPFFTGSRQGLGLGLAVCKAVVEGHGGGISAANSPGGGAKFIVELPAL